MCLIVFFYTWRSRVLIILSWCLFSSIGVLPLYQISEGFNNKYSHLRLLFNLHFCCCASTVLSLLLELYMSVAVLVPYCLYYHSSTTYLEVLNSILSWVLFLLMIALAICGVFWFLMDFRLFYLFHFPLSVGNMWVFDWDCSESIHIFWYHGDFHINSTNLWTWNVFPFHSAFFYLFL